MATNFSPCKGSYVLNQFPSNVMFAMNGFTYQPVERYRAIMALLLCVCSTKEADIGYKDLLLSLQEFYKVLYCTIQSLKPFGNIVGKGENAVLPAFVLFPKCFLPFEKQF